MSTKSQILKPEYIVKAREKSSAQSIKDAQINAAVIGQQIHANSRAGENNHEYMKLCEMNRFELNWRKLALDEKKMDLGYKITLIVIGCLMIVFAAIVLTGNLPLLLKLISFKSASSTVKLIYGLITGGGLIGGWWLRKYISDRKKPTEKPIEE